MDDELGIILTTTLEADEEGSAQRIASQLPSIAEKINSRSAIKVGVSLSDADIKSTVDKVYKRLGGITNSKKINMEFGINDTEQIKNLEKLLSRANVSADVADRLKNELNDIYVSINNINSTWRENGLTLDITGVDSLNRAIQYTSEIDTNLGSISTKQIKIGLNLEKERKEADAIAKRTEADNASRIKFLTQQQIALDKIRASYSGETSAKGITNVEGLEELNKGYNEIAANINSLMSAEGKLSAQQQADIRSQIAQLDLLDKKYKNQEYVATKLQAKGVETVKEEQINKLRQFEVSLKNSGTYAEKFASDISDLRTQLNGVEDKDGMRSYIDQFSLLESKVKLFKEELSGVNEKYKELTSVDTKMAEIRMRMANVGEGTSEYKALSDELETQRERAKALSNEISNVVSKNIDLQIYSSGYSEFLRAQVENAEQLGTAEATVADKASIVTERMSVVPSIVESIQLRFNGLLAPSAALEQRVGSLAGKMEAVSNAKSDKEKVAAYEELSRTIADCNKELAQLSRSERIGTADFKFAEGLKKAQADLDTIGKKWSALKQDQGLNAQFIQLQNNLKSINTADELKRWNASFDTFRAQVKAAGKDMLTFGDTMKNNLTKVTQWVSVTTLLFRAFRTLKSGINTVTELDTALIDLKKTTDATNEEYERFYVNSNKTAKQLGVTTQEVISQTAEWSRLGYTLEDAAMLAENSAIFKAISPEMDISTATDGLISAIKAYDIDVEDSLDGIISKINKIGNEFAVSNNDIVEVLTRSSSAMSVANNNLDETVALATAAIEITRDASSVGNLLKTASMRIRAIDEETETFSEDLVNIKSDIADLTKTASNPTGVRIFEENDPETYRSTYDILSDIADVWDEISDKDQASLLEVLGGKRGSQVMAAILKNFDQARNAVTAMQNSSGNAMKEMEVIYDSIEYKMNELKQTWVGVAQSLFSTGDIKATVEVLNDLSGIIAFLTDKLGLFGTVFAGTFIANIAKIIKTTKEINTAITPVLQSLAGTTFDASNSSVVVQYADAMLKLDGVQQQAAISALGLSEENKQLLMSMMELIGVTSQYTVAEIEKMAGVKAGTISNKLNVSSTEQVTAAILKAIIATEALKEEQIEQIRSNVNAAISNKELATSYDTVNASSKAAMASNPAGWIMLIITAIPAAIRWIKELVVTEEEAAENAKTMVAEYDAQADTLSKLEVQLEENKVKIKELEDAASDNFTIIEDGEIDKLKQANAELQTMIDSRRELAKENAKEANASIVDAFNSKKFRDISIESATADVASVRERGLEALGKNFTKINPAMYNEGTLKSNNIITPIHGYVPTKEEIQLLQQYNDQIIAAEENLEGVARGQDSNIGYERYVSNLVERYKELNAVQEQGGVLTDTQATQLAQVRNELLTASSDLQDNFISQYIDTGEDDGMVAYFESIRDAISATLFPMDYFKEKLSELPPEISEVINTSGGAGELTDLVVQNLINKFPALKALMDSTGITAHDVANEFNYVSGSTSDVANKTEAYSTALSALKDVQKENAGIASVLTLAEKDMAAGYGATEATIKALMDATEDWQDFLYEEDGLLKINTDALREYKEAKVEAQKQKLVDNTDALIAERDKINDNLKAIDEASGIDEVSEAYSKLIKLARDAGMEEGSAFEYAKDRLEELSKEIEDNQNLIAAYGSLDANPFSETFDKFDGALASLKSLAEIQQEVASGFTISADKAREFAAVYPEILNSASVTANGQVQLNSDVVNSFLRGKEAEIDGGIEADIAKLEADKAILTSKVDLAQAQLDLAESVAQGESDLTWEEAQYRIEASNALQEALVQAGINEAEANKLTAQAMAGNEEEFAKVARESFKNVSDNSAKAAYNAAQNFLNMSRSSSNNIAQIANQAHETAKAIASMDDGVVSGASVSLFSGSSGSYNGVGSLSPYQSTFRGSDAKTTTQSLNLDNFISQTKIDISNYKSKIAEIDGQIALLRSLKNSTLGKIASMGKSGGGSGGGGGSGSGGSSSSSKDIEEYVVDIDAYREALERLAKTKQDIGIIQSAIQNSDNLFEEIRLQKQLTQAYQREQEALNNLNNQRDKTINGSVEYLRRLGFIVEYNDSTNELYIQNLEYVNELVAESKGKYDTLQEATNALRKETEDLIDSITELNEDNRDASDQWWELKDSMAEARAEIQELLRTIVEQSSKAVDDVQGLYDALHVAADEFAETGYISVDSFQDILSVGTEYVAYLEDENGNLDINEERIRDVIKARTEQMAIESSMSYVEALRIAQENKDIESLSRLLDVTRETVDSTWGLVYAELELLNLDNEQKKQALENINAIRAMAETAMNSIGQVSDSSSKSISNMQDGLQDFIDNVMDMLKDKIDEQKNAIEEMKDAYSEIINLKKESLDKSKEESDYQKKVRDQLKEIADLQSKIDSLSLDDSRDAQAEKASLAEELNKLQQELADEQNEHAIDAQKEALESMNEAYARQKDEEIKKLENSVSSTEKLYELAVEYIGEHFDNLYDELIDWNYNVGSSLRSEIVSAWEDAANAAEKYGGILDAINSLNNKEETSSQNLTVAKTNYSNDISDGEMVAVIARKMYSNSQLYSTADSATKQKLHDENEELAKLMSNYGVDLEYQNSGWIVKSSSSVRGISGKNIYDVYKDFVSYRGGASSGTNALASSSSRILSMSDIDVLKSLRMNSLSLSRISNSPLSNANNVTTNNNPVSVTFGDTIIYGADQNTINKHNEITRNYVNEVLSIIGFRR